MINFLRKCDIEYATLVVGAGLERCKLLKSCISILYLEKCCEMVICLQKSASIQPRTSSPKFGLPRILGYWDSAGGYWDTGILAPLNNQHCRTLSNPGCALRSIPTSPLDILVRDNLHFRRSRNLQRLTRTTLAPKHQ